ncbi:MAG TPA: T9SS type A sorting domain-containing protein [Chitinophagaceae bacterium]|nr:T9SS type A sorting domain-containing protein [Chitinophagaceae bacterium]
MKNVLFFATLICIFTSSRATTYYSVNLAAPNLTASWHINRNGTGASPSNFSGADVFVIQAGHSMTTTNPWTLSNKSAIIRVESGAILQADDKITVDNFELNDHATYIHNVGSAVFPGSVSRNLATTSTVQINNWASSKLPTPTTWGNLVFNLTSYNTNWNLAGSLTDVAGNLVIQSTGTAGKELRLATTQDYTLSVGGDLMLQGGILEAGQNNTSANQQITLNGSLLLTGGSFTRSDNKGNPLTILFQGDNSKFNLSGASLTNTYMTWEVAAGKKLSLLSDLPVASGRSLVVNGTLDFSTYHLTGAGGFTASPGSSLITAGSQGLNGSIQLTGTASLSDSLSYQFDGPTTTPFPASAAGLNAKNLIVNAGVTLNRDITLKGSLYLNSGLLSVPAGTTLTLTGATALVGSGYGDSKHIATLVNAGSGARGTLRIRNFSGNTLFPVGTDTYYLPVRVNVQGASDFSVTAFQGATRNGAPNGTLFDATTRQGMVDATWIVNRNGGSGAADLQLGWPSALEGSAFKNLTDNQIGIAHYDGTSWDQPLGSGSQSGNTALRTAIASFSPFQVGKGDVVLPLDFSSVKAYQKNTNVWLEWTSLNEQNVDHFEPERAGDGRRFASLGKQPAKGSGGMPVAYSWLDSNPVPGAGYYRVKAVDRDGKITYSSVVRVDFDNGALFNPQFVLYPNPVSGRSISYQVANAAAGEYKLFLYDREGRILYTKIINHPGGNLGEIFELPPSVTHGIYNLRLNSRDMNLVKSFVVN